MFCVPSRNQNPPTRKKTDMRKCELCKMRYTGNDIGYMKGVNNYTYFMFCR